MTDRPFGRLLDGLLGRRARTALGLSVVLVTALGLRACASGPGTDAPTPTDTTSIDRIGSSAAPTTSARPATTVPTSEPRAPSLPTTATAPPPAPSATTVPTSRSSPAGSVPAPSATTTSSNERAATTVSPVPPCTAATLGPALRAGGLDPAGLELADPRCTEDFASVVVRQANREDRFAVFELREPEWTLVNIGTSFVCQRLEIPNPDYTDIGCLRWDR